MKSLSFAFIRIHWEAAADVGLGVHVRDIFTGGRSRRAFGQQYRSNVSGRWEARKEDWLKIILDYSTIPKKMQPGQWRALEPKPLAGVVPLLTILACLAPLACSPVLTTAGEQSNAFSWLLHVGMTHSSEECFSKQLWCLHIVQMFSVIFHEIQVAYYEVKKILDVIKYYLAKIIIRVLITFISCFVYFVCTHGCRKTDFYKICPL